MHVHRMFTEMVSFLGVSPILVNFYYNVIIIMTIMNFFQFFHSFLVSSNFPTSPSILTHVLTHVYLLYYLHWSRLIIQDYCDLCNKHPYLFYPLIKTVTSNCTSFPCIQASYSYLVSHYELGKIHPYFVLNASWECCGCKHVNLFIFCSNFSNGFFLANY